MWHIWETARVRCGESKSSKIWVQRGDGGGAIQMLEGTEDGLESFSFYSWGRWKTTGIWAQERRDLNCSGDGTECWNMVWEQDDL